MELMDKLQTAREGILHRIEHGEFSAETKLPAAAKYSEETGVSFGVVQLAYNSLIRDGILYSIPRQGTFVRKDWRNRILPGCIQTHRPVWLDLLKPLKEETPELFLSKSFREGAFEIRFSNDTQLHASEYLDLTEFFEAEFPDKSDFFLEKIEQFRSRHGQLFGIPLIFPLLYYQAFTTFMCAYAAWPIIDRYMIAPFQHGEEEADEADEEEDGGEGTALPSPDAK